MAKKKVTTKKKVSRKITKEDLSKIAQAASEKVRNIQKAVFAKLASLKSKKKVTKKKVVKKKA